MWKSVNRRRLMLLMRNLFSDKLWNYKNFNMGTELDIAGDFIYDGIHTLNQMDVITQDSMLFSFLYHVSVGLERLQKIVVVLFENFNFENYEKFEKSLITHSHDELSERIYKSTQLELSSRENEFLQLLSTFYKSARYHRFNLKSQDNKEQKMIAGFIVKHISADKVQYHFLSNDILISEDVKILFGKVIGSISQKYYELICDGCTRNRTYTYELRNGSKAEKIFLSKHRNNSLQEQKITEMIALKELLVYLRNTKDKNSFTRFMQDIPPLDLEVAFLNEHIYELSKGIISQSLIDEVECLYEENSYSVERMEMVDAIGNPNVLFEYKVIYNCYNMLNDLVNDNYECKDFAVNFPEQLELIEDDDVYDILKDIPELCHIFLTENKPCEIFINEILPYYSEFKGICNF